MSWSISKIKLNRRSKYRCMNHDTWNLLNYSKKRNRMISDPSWMNSDPTFFLRSTYRVVKHSVRETIIGPFLVIVTALLSVYHCGLSTSRSENFHFPFLSVHTNFVYLWAWSLELLLTHILVFLDCLFPMGEMEAERSSSLGLIITRGRWKKICTNSQKKKERGEEAPMPRTVRGLPQTLEPGPSSRFQLPRPFERLPLCLFRKVSVVRRLSRVFPSASSDVEENCLTLQLSSAVVRLVLEEKLSAFSLRAVATFTLFDQVSRACPWFSPLHRGVFGEDFWGVSSLSTFDIVTAKRSHEGEARAPLGGPGACSPGKFWKLRSEMLDF